MRTMDRDGYTLQTVGQLKAYLDSYQDDDLLVKFYAPDGERLEWVCDNLAEGETGPFVLVDLE